MFIIKNLFNGFSFLSLYDLSKGIFIINKSHEKKYNLIKNVSKALGKKIKFELLNDYTDGAPQTIMSIKDLISKDHQFL